MIICWCLIFTQRSQNVHKVRELLGTWDGYSGLDDQLLKCSVPFIVTQLYIYCTYMNSRAYFIIIIDFFFLHMMFGEFA